MKNGQIKLNLIYSDVNNERREVEKIVEFDRDNFQIEAQGSTWWRWFLAIIIVGGVAWWHLRRRKKRKQKEHAAAHRN